MKTVIAFFLLPVVLVIAQETSRPTYGPGDSATRGKYLVEQVAMCVECHTPRDGTGQLLRTKYLKGAPIPVKPPHYPNVKWAIKAPAIAGLPGYSDEQAIRLLVQGITADGRQPNPPMPAFRFARRDAEAVVAYLKSLQ